MSFGANRNVRNFFRRLQAVSNGITKVNMLLDSFPAKWCLRRCLTRIQWRPIPTKGESRIRRSIEIQFSIRNALLCRGWISCSFDLPDRFAYLSYTKTYYSSCRWARVHRGFVVLTKWASLPLHLSLICPIFEDAIQAVSPNLQKDINLTEHLEKLVTLAVKVFWHFTYEQWLDILGLPLVVHLRSRTNLVLV